MQSHFSHPPHPFPLPLYLLSAHYTPFICLQLHSFTLFPFFSSALPLSFPPLPSSLPHHNHPCDCSSSLRQRCFLCCLLVLLADARLLLYDYSYHTMMSIIAFRMAVFNTVWEDQDALSNLDLIKTWEEISPRKTHSSAVSFFVFVSWTTATLLSFCCYCSASHIIITAITITISSRSCPSVSCLHFSPFENFEEFGFAAMLSPLSLSQWWLWQDSMAVDNLTFSADW